MKNPYLKSLGKIEFVVTNACTGRCKHCQCGTPSERIFKLDAKASADAVRKICKEYDIKTVMAFGGEPLLNPECVYEVMRVATELGVAKRQVITNGYFSKNRDEIRNYAKSLSECGVNDLLLSVDVFHQETIPIDTVMLFAKAAMECGLPLRLQPAWLVSRESENPYNERTREILSAFLDLGIPASEGNVVFPEGNAKVFLSEYFENFSPENPYTVDPCDVKCLSIDADGGLLDGNIYSCDVTKILDGYSPHRNPLT